MRAVNRFYENYARYPSPQDQDKLYHYFCEIKNEFYGDLNLEDHQDITSEFCRYEDSRLHNISALIGGVAAQEAVKLISH